MIHDEEIDNLLDKNDLVNDPDHYYHQQDDLELNHV